MQAGESESEVKYFNQPVQIKDLKPLTELTKVND